MFEVKADQYQVLDDVEITVDGLTLLVGSADNGKSSVMRAVHGSLHNQTGDDFIQEGTDETSVELDFGDLDVKWEKERGSGADYYVNEEHFDKIGRGYFDELIEQGFSPIQAGPDEFKLQFWMQMAPFLICNRPNTRKFEILSNIFESDKFADVLDEMKGERKQLKKDVGKKETQINLVEEDIEKAQNKRSVYTEFFGRKEEDMEQLRSKHERLEKLEDLKNRMKKTEEQLDQLSECINSCDEFMDDVELKYLENKIDLLGKLSEYGNLSNYIEDVNSVESLFSNVSLEKLSANIDVLNTIKEFRGCKKTVDNLSSLGFGFALDVEQWESKVYCVEALDEFKQKQNEVEQKGIRIEEATNELSEVHDKLSDVKDELEVCPTCNQPLGVVNSE